MDNCIKVAHIVGARPNFMKLSPVHRALKANDTMSQMIIHSGQHYDNNMSNIFFSQLDIPKPDYNLGIGSGKHGKQTGEALIKIEEILLENTPDIVLVYGDVNATVSGALAAAKLHIKIGHVESGLRSRDRFMPEEINRIITDHISDILFCPSADAIKNLESEGIPSDRTHMVGNVMIDTLKNALCDIQKTNTRKKLNIPDERYGVITLHRPSNVDDVGYFSTIINSIEKISEKIPIVFPVHPRTKKIVDQIIRNNSISLKSRIIFMEPLGYFEFLSLISTAVFVVTDSGGIQEETTFLNVPCLTLRKNTERPITVEMGTNILVGNDMELLMQQTDFILNGKTPKSIIPDKWDGKSGDRISKILKEFL